MLQPQLADAKSFRAVPTLSALNLLPSAAPGACSLGSKGATTA